MEGSRGTVNTPYVTDESVPNGTKLSPMSAIFPAATAGVRPQDRTELTAQPPPALARTGGTGQH